MTDHLPLQKPFLNPPFFKNFLWHFCLYLTVLTGNEDREVGDVHQKSWLDLKSRGCANQDSPVGYKCLRKFHYFNTQSNHYMRSTAQQRNQ